MKITKLLTPQSPSRPSLQDEGALGAWRSAVLAGMEKRVSPRGLELVRQKFLVPQQWKATVKAITKAASIAKEDEVVIEGMANAADPDRGRELILTSAWQLKNFELNPIVLFNHNYNWPIGSCLEYKIEDNGLYYRASVGKPSAYPELTECQEMCRSLLAQGVLRASSVGFLPLDLEYDEENDVLRYTEVELLEISVVAVPMQQGSLLDSVGPAAKSVRPDTTKGGVKAMEKEQFEKLMNACDEHKKLTQKIHDKVCAEPPKEDEEKKSLKARVAELETQLKAVTDEKNEIEKQAGELLAALEKQGIVKPE